MHNSCFSLLLSSVWFSFSWLLRGTAPLVWHTARLAKQVLNKQKAPCYTPCYTLCNTLFTFGKWERESQGRGRHQSVYCISGFLQLILKYGLYFNWESQALIYSASSMHGRVLGPRSQLYLNDRVTCSSFVIYFCQQHDRFLLTNFIITSQLLIPEVERQLGLVWWLELQGGGKPRPGEQL